MYQVYTAVKIIDDELERHEQVGLVVNAAAGETPVQVKFDDGEIEEFAIGQIQAV
jgi:hypothetical protein